LSWEAFLSLICTSFPLSRPGSVLPLFFALLVLVGLPSPPPPRSGDPHSLLVPFSLGLSPYWTLPKASSLFVQSLASARQLSSPSLLCYVSSQNDRCAGHHPSITGFSPYQSTFLTNLPKRSPLLQANSFTFANCTRSPQSQLLLPFLPFLGVTAV